MGRARGRAAIGAAMGAGTLRQTCALCPLPSAPGTRPSPAVSRVTSSRGREWFQADRSLHLSFSVQSLLSRSGSNALHASVSTERRSCCAVGPDDIAQYIQLFIQVIFCPVLNKSWKIANVKASVCSLFPLSANSRTLRSSIKVLFLTNFKLYI